MRELAMALGLVLVLEGLLYAVIPRQLKRMMAAILPVPEETLRLAGLLAAVCGLMLVLAVRE